MNSKNTRQIHYWLALLFLTVSWGGHAQSNMNWYQIPGLPVWLDTGLEWRVQGDPTAAKLSLRNPKSGRIEISAQRAQDSSGLLKSVMAELQARYTGGSFAMQDGVVKGVIPLDGVKLQVQGEARVIDGYAVAVFSLGGKANQAKLKSHVMRLFDGVKVQWKRPGGGDVLIPGASAVLRQPETGWQAKTEGKVLRMISAVEGVKLELRAEVQGQRRKPQEAMTRWSEGMLPAEFVWGPTKKSKLAGLEALTRSAVADIQGKRWSAVVTVLSVKQGVLVMLGTEQLLGGTESRRKELDTIMASLRLRGAK